LRTRPIRFPIRFRYPPGPPLWYPSRPMSRSKLIEIFAPDFGVPTMPRRDFLQLLGKTGLATLVARLAVAPGRPAFAGEAGPWVPSFPEGIKSGDPLPTGAVIWTRLAPPPDGHDVTVLWSVAEDAAMEQVVTGGLTLARAGGGHHAKHRVHGLRPDRWYHYRFEVDGVASVVGRLRTAPRSAPTPDHLRYAYSSCQQRTASYYVAHRGILNDDVDFFLHLGDYVYVNDVHTLTVDNYRDVYRRFHSNPLLQELQAAVPLVAVWDDGEFYNGVDSTGPAERLANARQAWFESMPVQRRPSDRTYRTFRWGRLADFILLDTRQYRDPEVPANSNFAGVIDAQDTALPPGEQMFAAGRTTLGAPQKQWFKQQLRRQAATWRMVGSSYNVNPWKVIDRDTPELRLQNPNLQRNGGVYVSNEAWDDYQAERRELLEHIVAHQIENVVFNSGHTHFYVASDLQPDFDDPASPIAAIDFTSGSLTADPDPRTIAPEELLHAAETLMLQANTPYMRHIDLLHQGYILVDVTPEETVVRFRYIDTFDANAVPFTGARFRVVQGQPGMEVLPPD
jgi:alkaline phosphatase D